MAAKQIGSIALDRLEADLAIVQGQQAAAAVPIRNPAPTILFSVRPAVLVTFTGSRIQFRSKAPGFRVINTRVLLLTDAAGIYYLHLYNGYMQAPALYGPGQSRRKPLTAHRRPRTRRARPGRSTCSKAPRIPRPVSVQRSSRPDPRDLRGYHTDRADRHPRPRGLSADRRHAAAVCAEYRCQPVPRPGEQ